MNEKMPGPSPDPLEESFNLPSVTDAERQANKKVEDPHYAATVGALENLGRRLNPNGTHETKKSPEAVVTTTGHEALATDIAQQILEQQQRILETLATLNEVLSRLTANASIAVEHTTGRHRATADRPPTMVVKPSIEDHAGRHAIADTRDLRPSSADDELPDYELSHRAQIEAIAERQREYKQRKANAEVRKAGRREAREQGKAMRKAERADWFGRTQDQVRQGTRKAGRAGLRWMGRTIKATGRAFATGLTGSTKGIK